MDYDIIKKLFCMLSDEPDWEPYQAIVNLAIHQVGRLVAPDSDKSDIRISFLCAAMANYRLQQVKAAHERSQYTYAGKMENGAKNTALAYAERLLRDYLQMSSELLIDKPFVFMSFSGGEEKIK